MNFFKVVNGLLAAVDSKDDVIDKLFFQIKGQNTEFKDLLKEGIN